MRSTRPRIAVLSSQPASLIAVAACTFSASALRDAGDGLVLMQLTPPTDFLPSDGRTMDVPAWRMSAAIGQRLVARATSMQRQPAVIDYEHQTLHKETNGQPAPAAGWMHGLRWIDGEGLFAVAKLTARAREQIDAEEYLYVSPVFEYHPQTGEVQRVLMAALTNHPAIHGMQALNAMRAAASALIPQPEPQMPPLLKALLAALGLPDTTTEEQATAALTALGPLAQIQARASAACSALSLPADAPAEAITAACAARTTAAPDPAKFVPVETVTQLQSQMAALTARQVQHDVDALITPALADGRLLPAMEDWARDLGKTNLAALSAYLDKAQPIAALASTQTLGKPPVPTGDKAMTAEQVAFCSAMGITADQFKGFAG